MSNERWLTKKEAATESKYSTKTIERAIKKGALRKVKNGVRRVRIAYSELLRWMNGNQARGVS